MPASRHLPPLRVLKDNWSPFPTPTKPGDLNYRSQVFVGEILGKLAATAEIEKARRGWAPYSGHAWRDDSYNRFFLPPSQRRSLAEAAAVQARISTLRDPVVLEPAQRAVQARARQQELRLGQGRGGDSPSESRWVTAAAMGCVSSSSSRGAGRAASASSNSSGEGGGEGDLNSLAEMLDAMRAAKCPLTTHDDVEAHGAVGARHWDWACEIDELSLSRKAGVAFHGFQEGPLAFPPTFKFHPGRSVEDYADVMDLRYGYQVRKGSDRMLRGGSPKDTRAPSWTDRILHHSLPGLESRLLLEAYDTCDAITGSDHRPVAAAFQLLLDKPVDPAAAEFTDVMGGGPVLPRRSPPPSLFSPGALPRIPLGLPRPPRRIDEVRAEAAAPRPQALAAAGSSSTSSGILPTRHPTPSPPPPMQLSRVSTAVSSITGFMPSLPAAALVPSTTKTILLSVRLSNFAFRFQLPRKPELQVAQVKGKKGKRAMTAAEREQNKGPSVAAAAATSAGVSASAAVAAATASATVTTEARGAARRAMRATAAIVESANCVEHEEEDLNEEKSEEFKSPASSVQGDSRDLGAGGRRGGDGAEHAEDEDGLTWGPLEAPSFVFYSTPTSHITPQLAQNPPSYLRQRSVPLPSRTLRAFTRGVSVATAAERRRRAEEREEQPPPVPREDDIGWVVVMMPIPCEDPLVSHRRIVMMLDQPDEAPSPPSSSLNGSSTAAPRRGLGAWLGNRLRPRAAGRSPPLTSATEGADAGMGGRRRRLRWGAWPRRTRHWRRPWRPRRRRRTRCSMSIASRGPMCGPRAPLSDQEEEEASASETGSCGSRRWWCPRGACTPPSSSWTRRATTWGKGWYA